MAHRPFRIVLVLFGLLVTAGLGYRALQDEQALDRARRDSRSVDRSAQEAVGALADLRASLHAYVAPGQGLASWAARSSSLVDTIRERLIALDTALAASGGSLAESLDGVDQLTAAERRARAYAGRGEPLLAGDVIFTEVRDLISAATDQVSAALDALHSRGDRHFADLRQEQAGLVLAAVALWVVIAFVMLPSSERTTAADPQTWRHELADRLKKPAATPQDSGELRRDLPGAAFGREGVPLVPAEPVQAGVPAAALKSVGEICSDLSALADVGALPGALERAAGVLGASGVIVWIASTDGGTLSPVASHGFDARLVARIGTIARNSSNMTAAAFRENVARVGAATGSASAALAVSMCGPSGPVGVLSAELRAGREADEACVALATIFAAQLATLAFPTAAPAATRHEAEPAADKGPRRAAR